MIAGECGEDFDIGIPGGFFRDKALDESGNHDGLRDMKQVGADLTNPV